MFSVPSDIPASTTVRTAVAKTSRSDASHPSDSFAALVEAAAAPDTSTSPLPGGSSSPAPRSSASSPSRESARTDSDRAAQAKSPDKSDGSSSRPDRSKAADATASAQATAAPTPVAVALPSEIILTNVVSGAAATNNDGSSTTPAASVPAGPSGVGPQGAVDATAGLAAAAAKSAGATKTSEDTTAATAGSGTATTPSGDAAASADQSFTAALDASAAGDAKTTGKPAAQTKTGLVNGDAGKVTEQGNGPVQGAQQPTHGLTQQPAVGAKPETVPSDDTGKASGNTQPPSGHDRNGAQAANQANAPASDPTAQLATALQPQLTTPTSQSGQITSANLTATAATATAVPLHGLAVEIAASALNGKSRFEIRLDPAELGRIDVRIDVDRNGQVTSHLRVEKPETLAMLQQTAPQLQQALQDAGLKSNNSGLQFSLRDQNSSGQNGGDNQQNGNAQRLIVTEDETVPAQLAGRSYGRVFSAQGGVDIRV